MHCAGHCSGQVHTSPTPCPRRRGRGVGKVWVWRGQSANITFLLFDFQFFTYVLKKSHVPQIKMLFTKVWKTVILLMIYHRKGRCLLFCRALRSFVPLSRERSAFEHFLNSRCATACPVCGGSKPWSLVAICVDTVNYNYPSAYLISSQVVINRT